MDIVSCGVGTRKWTAVLWISSKSIWLLSMSPASLWHHSTLLLTRPCPLSSAIQLSQIYTDRFVLSYLPFSYSNSSRKWDQMFGSCLWKDKWILFLKYIYFHIFQVPVFILCAHMWSNFSRQGAKLDSPMTLGASTPPKHRSGNFHRELCLKK